METLEDKSHNCHQTKRNLADFFSCRCRRTQLGLPRLRSKRRECTSLSGTPKTQWWSHRSRKCTLPIGERSQVQRRSEVRNTSPHPSPLNRVHFHLRWLPHSRRRFTEGERWVDVPWVLFLNAALQSR